MTSFTISKIHYFQLSTTHPTLIPFKVPKAQTVKSDLTGFPSKPLSLIFYFVSQLTGAPPNCSLQREPWGEVLSLCKPHVQLPSSLQQVHSQFLSDLTCSSPISNCSDSQYFLDFYNDLTSGLLTFCVSSFQSPFLKYISEHIVTAPSL